jgi:phospholipid/cholesterol/gamma-HCH transport system permease protein
MTPPRPASTPPTAALRTDGPRLVLEVGGDWSRDQGGPGLETLLTRLGSVGTGDTVTVRAVELGAWDSTLAAFLLRASATLRGQGAALDRTGLPMGLQRLLALAEAVPEKSGARRRAADDAWLDSVGKATLRTGEQVDSFLAFLGGTALAFGRALRGAARFRRQDLLVLIEQAGFQALGVVALINFLVGLILAFVAAAQLEQFGAAVYVANLVAIAMLRDMAAIMTAIVMAGRSGAAYAAAIGTMNANQEIDALRTTGIAPLEYLVVPRITALVLMMPLLTVFADLMGVLGGAVVATSMLDLGLDRYLEQAKNAVAVKHLLGGVFKGTVYGALVGIAGCWRGMQSGRTAAAVGEATTSAVVTSLILIIGAAGLFAVVFYALGL